MTGTEKQIAWANDIINVARNQLDLCEEYTKKHGENIARYKFAHIAKYRADLEKLVAAKDDAKFWIDNRAKFTGEFIIDHLHGWFEQEKILARRQQNQ